MIKMLGEIKLIHSKFIAEPETRHEQIGSHADDQCAVEAGWYVCNGENYTPDLLDKSLRMKKHAGEAGGADSHTLSVAEMPSHYHHQKYRDIVNGASAGSAVYQMQHANPNPNQATQNCCGNTGGGAAHNNIPAYKSLIPIIKLHDVATGIQIFDIIPNNGWTSGIGKCNFDNEKNIQIRWGGSGIGVHGNFYGYIKTLTANKDIEFKFTYIYGYDNTIIKVYRIRAGTETLLQSNEDLTLVDTWTEKNFTITGSNFQAGDFIRIDIELTGLSYILQMKDWSLTEEA